MTAKTKKLYFIGITAVSIVLAACGGKTESTATDNTTSGKEATVTPGKEDNGSNITNSETGTKGEGESAQVTKAPTSTNEPTPTFAPSPTPSPTPIPAIDYSQIFEYKEFSAGKKGDDFPMTYLELVGDTSAYMRKDGTVFDTEKYEEAVDKLLTEASNLCVITGVKAKTEKELVVPSEIDGKKVIAIASYAFYENSALESLKIMEGVLFLPESCIINCPNLKKIELPDSILYMGEQAITGTGDTELESSLLYSYLVQRDGTVFLLGEYCKSGGQQVEGRTITGLDGNRLVIPETYLGRTVTGLGEYAFSDTRAYFTESGRQDLLPEGTTLVLPKSLWYLGDYTFMNSKNITAIEFDPEQIEYLGIRKSSGKTEGISLDLFDYAQGMSYRVINGEVEVTGYLGGYDSNPNLVIPADIGGRPVTAIGENAFSWKDITSVVLPECLVTIGDEAFYKCNKITELVLPDSVKKVGSEAFYGPVFTKLILNEGLEWIGDYAFSEAKIDIVLPSTVTYIGTRAFFRAASLTGFTDQITYLGTDVVVDEKRVNLAELPFGALAYDETEDGVVILGYAVDASLDELVIPEQFHGKDVISISHTFKKAPRRLVVEGSVTFDESAFADCGRLQEIVLRNGAFYLGKAAFKNCSGLKSITLENVSEFIAGDVAFYGCSGLKDFAIEAGRVELGYHVSGGSSGIERVSIHADEIVLGADCFESLGNLTSVEVYGALEEVGAGAFKRNKKLTSVQLPDGVKIIGASAFSECEALTQITLPSNLQKLGNNVFEDCENLIGITLPYGLQILDNYAFQNCKNLTEITLPEGLTRLGKGVFEGSGIAASDAIPAYSYELLEDGTVAFLGYPFDKVLEGQEEFPQTIFGKTITVIGERALSSLKSYEELVIPEGVRVLKDDAINGNSVVKTIKLPTTIEEIGTDCFISISKLEKVIVPSMTADLSASGLNIRRYKNLVIVTPEGSKADEFAKKEGFKVER